MSMSFTSPGEVDRYRAIVLAQGLDMWRKHKMRPNRAYTPSAMMRAAELTLDRKFKPRAYQEAADALRAWAHRETP